MKNEFLNKVFRGDKGIWMIFMFLCMISIVEVFSATSQLAYQTGRFWSPISSHSIHLIMGFGIVLAVQFIPHKWWKVFCFPMLILSAFLLVYVMVAGQKINGASRWLNIGGFAFQPSEVAKLAVIMTISLLLSRMQDVERDGKRITLWIAGIAVAICGLIALDNLSTAGLLAIVSISMMIIGGTPKKYLAPVLGGGALVAIIVLAFFVLTPSKTMAKIGETTHVTRLYTWQRRIKEFIVVLPDEPKEYVIADNNRQISHALIAVSSSGIIGCGPGNSIQRDFLAQAYSDFIYAIIIEELGLVGGILVLLLYIALLMRAGRIARKCNSRFSALLVMGCALMLVTQAMINMLISVNLFPVTGQPLPIISRGGTSILISCVYIGIILNISRSVEPTIILSSEQPAEADEVPALNITDYERDEAELI